MVRAATSAFFDPHMSTSSNDIRVSFNLFDNLTSRHPDGKLHPGLATEWKLEGADHLAVQAAPGREVPQRRPLHLGGREGEPRADLRSRRQDPRGHGLHHHRPHRGAGSMTLVDPHEEARSAPAGAARLLRRADRPGQVLEGERRGGLQSQARRHGAGPVRLVDQGRRPDHGSQPGLLGREDRRRPGRSSARCPRRRRALPAC